jgi:two-component system LytT family response regulator
MKISALIVDDEKDARDSLQLMLENFFIDDIEVVATAKSVKEAVKAVNKYNPELVFLDIEMPNENGFGLFDYFKESYPFEVIFVTAYDQYALRAIQSAALDYVLKPINKDELVRAVERYKQRAQNNSNVRINTFLTNISNNQDIHKKIVFPTHDQYIVERLDNILYCQAEINYTRVFTNERNYVISTTLKKLEELLPSTLFCRIHKSYLINLNYVKSLDKKSYKVKLNKSVELDIAQRRINLFLEQLSNV